ncbi:MAG: hypothetical protein NTY98_05520 [Verrucomicrobia bacterium]|nr:hypothetical protein [Verrucomicrobiota bacterium]
MTHPSRGCLIALALLGAVVLAWFWSGRPTGWKEMARMTGVKVPAGAVMSAVEHPTEVAYLGTIDLKSDADVQEFIRLNGLTRMIEHVQDDGWLHRGRLAYEVPKERYADTWVLWAHSEYNAWEFVLDPSTRRVRYEVLVPDYAGDLPFDDRAEGGTPGKD